MSVMIKIFVDIFQIYVIFLQITQISETCDCFNDNSDIKCTFGSKTPYRCVANHNVSQLIYPGCTERKIWMMIRHGTRYPQKKHILSLLYRLPLLQQEILNIYESNKSYITEDLAHRLYEWKTDFTEEFDVQLATEGKNEMINLGQRMQSRFPTLFPDKYSENLYNYTATQRTEDSAKYFTIGLFGKDKYHTVNYLQPEKEDLILRFYKSCMRWQMEINHNIEAYEERKKFLKSTFMQNVLTEISNHLGYTVNYSDVRLMRMMCVFETALDKLKSSPWCDLFSFEQLKTLEYAEDLGYYWIDGYGYKLTYEHACPALVNMFNSFQSDNSKSVTVYFSHSGTLLKLLAALKLAKDDNPLTHDTFPIHQYNRAWRTSVIDAFATNIAFVLYNCEVEGPSILTMHQERAVHPSGCPQNRPCPIRVMKQLYPDNDEECQFETMCALPNTEL